MPPQAATNYSQLLALLPPRKRLRRLVRDLAVFPLSLRHSLRRGSGLVHFPLWHHVFDDERRGFARQLRYLRQFGDFVSLDDAVAMLSGGAPIEGRYFCVTFDDGFANCVRNALPLLVEASCPAAFFVPTDLIGLHLERDWDRLQPFFSAAAAAYPLPVEFMTWDDCRQLLAAGMCVGSHTCSHAVLAEVDEERAAAELRDSAAKLEAELGQPCRHFAAPQGRYDRQRDPALARTLGYRSFCTSERGANRLGESLFALHRDRLLANWPAYQLCYFLGVR